MTKLKARYYQNDGSEGKAQALPEWLFDGVVQEDVLHQVIKAYLSNQRQGTASAKTRGQVRGGGRKPFRQKGTGRARQGTIRAVQMVGGGVAFPPIPHSWRQRVPRKVRALARRSAFNSRAQGDRVVLVDALEFETPKTRTLVDLLGTLGAEGKVLVLTDGVKTNVYLSSRNLQDVVVRPFGEESAYDILWAGLIVIEKAALEASEPSDSDKAAMKSRARAEPEVRVRERAAEEARVERRKARPGHDKTSRRGKAVKAEAGAAKAAPKAEAEAKVEAKAEPTARSEAESKAASPKEAATKASKEAAPKATEEAAPKAALEEASPEASSASGDEQDLSAVKLPTVGDLAKFLAQFDSEADVKALMKRDSRKTAVPHYEARLTELSGSAKGKKD